MPEARQIAFDVLVAVERGAQSGDELDQALVGVSAREAGLATELVYGVLRRRAQLHALIGAVSSRRPDKMDAPVRIAIELGAYQMRYLDRVPDHAAVSESVNLAKRARKASAAPMVNAVLRRLPRLPQRWNEEAIEYSLPTWLWRRWVARYGLETARGIGAAGLTEPAAYVRSSIALEGCKATEVSRCWRVTGTVPRDARRMDIGAQTVVPLLDLHPGQVMLDLCAAPGNKTAQALETDGVRVVACDSSIVRLRAFQVENLPKIQLDATEVLPFGRVFDRILVDAPCSGTGTLGRNPEIRWRLSEADLRRQSERQKLILANALQALKPGGRLVYATCSLETEENEDVVRAVAEGRVRGEWWRVPGREPGDGFYAAAIE